MKIIMKIALMILIAGALYNCGEFPLNCDVNDEACLMQEENNARQSISTYLESPEINNTGELDSDKGGSDAIANISKIMSLINRADSDKGGSDSPTRNLD